ncbi:12195_t:CDS:1 [Cetraspora pellucida]|uniref:12195_t:CDS:1 n=1 Tax=Cetraspora pellucida TaxID=1433469 RepID=A0A9N9P744_9GLOM|nr:12195_t:CDS:1 [Cetraspora pellucida]
MPLKIFFQVSSQMLSQAPSYILLQIILQIPLQISLQILLQILLKQLQLLTNFLSQISNNVSLQLLNNYFPYLPNMSLQLLSNISLYTMPNISSQLISNISFQFYFMLFSKFSNLQPLYIPIYNLVLQELLNSSKHVSQLDEFFKKINKAKNANGEILACLSKFQNRAIQVIQIYKLTDKQLELVEIIKAK